MDPLTHDVRFSDTHRQIAQNSARTLILAHQGRLNRAIDSVVEDSPNHSHLWEADEIPAAKKLLTGFSNSEYKTLEIMDEFYPEQTRIIGDVWDALSGEEKRISPYHRSKSTEFPTVEMDDNGFWHISLSDEAMSTLATACYLYSQVRMGNFGALIEFPISKQGYEINTSERLKAHRALNEVAREMLGPMVFYSIAHEETPEDAKIAFDMFNTLSQARSFISPDGNLYSNQKFSKEDLIEVSKRNDYDTTMTI